MKEPSKGPLIVGSTGKVGRALHAVWPKNVTAFWQDRRGGDYRWDVLQEIPPVWPSEAEGLIGLAGTTQGEHLNDNAALAIATCELGARYGQRVLIASSQAVYGRTDAPATETTPCMPDTDYGRAKLAMEQAIYDFENVTILRIGNVIGCDNLMLNAATGGAIKLDQFDSGQGPQRSYIGPQVLCHVLRSLLHHAGPLPRILNISQPHSVAMVDILTAANVAWDWTATGPKALSRLDLDTTLLQTIIDVPDADAEQLVVQARAAGWVRR